MVQSGGNPQLYTEQENETLDLLRLRAEVMDDANPQSNVANDPVDSNGDGSNPGPEWDFTTLWNSIYGAYAGYFSGKYTTISGDDGDLEGGENEDDYDEDKKEIKRLTNMYRLESIVIYLSYFCVGFALTFITTPTTYYAVDTLNASAAYVNILSTVQSLPWSFKLFYGVLSDCVPINGKRRKPYFVIGWTIFVICNLLLTFLGTPNIQTLIALVFFSVCGYMLSDVMTDALVVERSKLEPTLMMGSIQATAYTLRYFGNILGAILGTILYNYSDWGWGLTIGQIFFINAAFPILFVFPFMWHLEDPFSSEEVRSLAEHCYDIWNMSVLRSVWQPMVFIYLYNVLMIPNAAWNNYLIEGLHFTDWMIGCISIAGAVFSWLGILFYRGVLFQESWRMIYVWTTVIMLIFSALQLLLIFQINIKMGIPNLWFALGDTTVINFVVAVQFLPMVRMFLSLCPDGAEGTSYALLTTYSNIASSVASNIGTLMTRIWDVSNEALADGDDTGMWKLTLLTSLLQPVGLAFIWCIPGSIEEQKILQKTQDTNFWGGFTFLTVLGFSLAFAVIITIVYIFV